MAEYGINVVANVQAQQLKSLLTQLQQLKNAAKEVNKIKITGDVQEQKESTAAVRERNKAIRENKKAQMEANRALLDSSNALMGGANAIRNTTAMVRASQKEVKKYSRDWNDLQRLITKLDFSAAFKDLEHFNKIAKQTADAFALMQKGGEGFPNFAGKLTLNELLKFEPANTTKALRMYQEVLQDVLADVDRGSDIYREFAARIEEVNRRLNDTSNMKGVPTTMYKKPIGPEQAPGFFDRVRKSTRFRDIATGAGFPLLFGGGPLQALGGGIGGGLGGLGGAIAGSAIVSQIEGFAKAAAQTGQAVNSVTGALQLAREQSLFSTDAEKERAAVLEEQGKVSELATLLTQQFADKIGNEGIESLQNLGKETDKTAKLWGTLTIQLQTLIAGPLTEFLKIVNNILGGITTEQRFKAFQKDIAGDPAALAKFAAIEAEVRGGRFKNVRGSGTGAEGTQFVEGKLTVARQEEILRRATAAGLRPANQIVPTSVDLRTITAKTRGKTQAEKDEEALQRLLIKGEKERERILARQVQVKGDMVLSLSDELALVRAQGDGTEKQVLQQQRIDELVRQTNDEGMRPMIEKYVKMINAQKELNAEAEKMSQLFQQIGTSIKDGVVDSISAAVEGTKSLAEVASNTLRRIANQLLDIGVNLALFGVPTGFGKKDSGGLLSSIFGERALGGSVSSGRPYMVGERGPELFVPGAQGNIVPNNAMGGANVTVNVDASGSSVQGDGPSAQQLGKAIGAAVQAELIKQKRPGGLLTR